MNRFVGLLTGILLVAMLTGVPAAAKVTLTFMHWEPAEFGMEESIARFEKANPDIDVEIVTAGAGEINEKLLARLAGGLPVDVFYVHADQFLTYQRQGLLLDITDFIKNDPMLGRPDYFLPLEQRRSTVNGRWYAIGSCWVIVATYYDPQAVEEAGLRIPSLTASSYWTWKQFADMAVKLTRRKPDGTIERYGVTIPLWYVPVSSFLASNRAGFLSPDGTKCILDQPEAIEVLNALGQLQSTLKASRWGWPRDLYDGTAAISIDGTWATSFAFANTGFPFRVAPLPVFRVPATHAQAHYHAIYAKTKYPKEAFRLLKFLTSEDYQVDKVRRGVWLPSIRPLITKLDELEDRNLMPRGYLREMVFYLERAGFTVQEPPGFGEAMAPFWDNVGSIWSGEKDAKQLMDAIVPTINALLKSKRGE